MIRNHFKRLLADKEFAESRTINLIEVAREADIHRNTLTRLANDQTYKIGTDVLDKLCGYFNCRVEQLIEYVPGVRLKDD
jgi:DNA-binding Xre family transcriptional regulator